MYASHSTLVVVCDILVVVVSSYLRVQRIMNSEIKNYLSVCLADILTARYGAPALFILHVV